MLKSEVVPHVVRKQFSKPLNTTIEDIPNESVTSPKKNRGIIWFMNQPSSSNNFAFRYLQFHGKFGRSNQYSRSFRVE